MEISSLRPSPSSSSAATHSLPRPVLHSRCLATSSGFSPWKKKLAESRSASRTLVVVAAKKKKSKADSHSFAPRPDESTGPFPEAVLLKKKTVKEDGRVEPEFADAEEEELYQFLSLQLESDLDVERVRHYEVVYLIHEDHADEVDNVVSKVQEFVRENKGRIWRLNNWGLRRLAYKIRKAKNATYILMNFELEAKWINDFKTMLDKDERIIRHLVMKRDEAITEDCPPPLEFHTLQQQGMSNEEDDESELETDDYESDDDGGENVIIVGEDGEDEDEDVSRRAMEMKAESVAR